MWTESASDEQMVHPVISAWVKSVIKLNGDEVTSINNWLQQSEWTATQHKYSFSKSEQKKNQTNKQFAESKKMKNKVLTTNNCQTFFKIETVSTKNISLWDAGQIQINVMQ